MNQCPRFALVLFATVPWSGLASAEIMNGDFADATIWRTEPAIGDAPSIGGGFALFEVIDQLDVRQLEQQFSLPATAATLSFDFRLETAAGGSGSQSAAADSFQATLYDLSFNSFFPSGEPALFPGFYSIDNDGAEFFDGSFVSVRDLAEGRRQVTLDLSSLGSQDVLLDFSLFGDNDQLRTTVFLDNVILGQRQTNIVPEPWSAGIWIIVGLILAAESFRRHRRQRLHGARPSRVDRNLGARATPACGPSGETAHRVL